MKSSKRIIYSRIIFITGIVLLTTLSALFIYETYQEYSSSSVIYNSRATRLSLEKVFTELKNRESVLLRFALSADSSYQKFKLAEDTLQARFSYIDSLIEDNSSLKTDLQRLKYHSDFINRQQESIISKLNQGGYTQSNAFHQDLLVTSMRMDSIRIIIDRMQTIASNLLRERSLDAQKHTIVATMMGVTVSIFSIIVFILAFYFIDQELKRSQDYLDETQMLNSKIGEINKELEHANNNLHKLNAELEGKNFQLEKYARELSSFTHITSHDMQEPLRKIEFYISIVQDRETQNLSEEGQKYLVKINKSVVRMRKLFLSMLDFSLTNTVDINIEEVDLNDVFQQTLHSFKVYIKDTNAVIDSSQLPIVKGIRYQLIQLFENIISNAIKFRKQDLHPEIQISCETIYTANHPIPGLKNDSRYHKIDFKDNGVGFEPQYSERVFEIFQRLIPKTDAHGVGIGLAICRKIAENHGGLIIAKSQPNEGAVFSLYLPVNS